MMTETSWSMSQTIEGVPVSLKPAIRFYFLAIASQRSIETSLVELCALLRLLWALMGAETTSASV